jgi:hypothetical protein
MTKTHLFVQLREEALSVPVTHIIDHVEATLCGKELPAQTWEDEQPPWQVVKVEADSRVCGACLITLAISFAQDYPRLEFETQTGFNVLRVK